MQSKHKITVLIYAHNEEYDISDAVINARSLTDTVTVVDIASTDKTASVAKKHRAEVVTTDGTRYVEPVRMDGIRAVNTEWFFILDADERLAPELVKEIQATISSSSTVTHYKILRKNIFGKKKWLKHGGWYPDSQIRLIKTACLKDWPKSIHSTPVIEGEMGSLTEPLLHYFHGDFKAMVNKTIVFEDMESDLLYKARRPVSVKTFFRKFLGELNRRLIMKSGWMDGRVGIIESIYQAYSKTVTYLYLFEKTYEKKKSSAL